MESFTKKVKEIVRTIPKGKIMTYSEVAAAAGNPKAERAVANVKAKDFDPDIPCHRVIRSDGRAGGYNRRGEQVKKALIEYEGAVVCIYVN